MGTAYLIPSALMIVCCPQNYKYAAELNKYAVPRIQDCKENNQTN